ncbi:hypothetical protein INT45_007563 [Circinella minor]|uniref:PHD-type domain-containing protein n=1 Tax=Circinella minor TaxID=1195481 RepID=A0A8H7VKD5_9FUNG|nr:hypothetical protein INT45_007563 [Circinella minor]
MTDKFCYALLKTTALQILQSAGFDAAHTDPTNSLTEVMSQYLQLLATTTSSYAELAGRSNGNIWDVVDGLNELGITPESLKEWLDLEGKALTPTWTAQSDPGRTLEVYEYKDIPSDVDEEEDEEEEIYSLESEEEEGLEKEKEKGEESIPKDDNKKEQEEENNGLPDYIPPYMPRFPSSIKEDATPPPRALPQVMPSITQQSSPGTAVPAPIIVRHRKKPVDNPFTHVVPFEESALATDKATTLALSLNENEENDNKQQQQQQPASKRRRVALSSLPMKKAMASLASNNDQQRRRQGDVLAGNHEMFRKFTQDEAAPGNTMFGNTNGVLEELLRRVAPPAMVSKLSSPNLLVDVATVPTSANPTSNGTALNQQENVTIKTSTTPSNTNNNNGGGTGATNSTSMLASLAGGQYSRKHSFEENITTPGLTQSASSSTIENQSSLSTSSTQPASTIVTIPTTAMTAGTTNSASTSSSNTPPSPSQRSNLTPISLASLSAGTNTGGSGKTKPSSGKSSSKSSSGKGTGEKKKLPKLTLNLTNGSSSSGGGNDCIIAPSTAENTPSSATSLNTPKIRFKIKPPEPANEKIDITSTDDSPSTSSSSAPPPQSEPSQNHALLPVSTSSQQRQQSPVTATTIVTHPSIVPPLQDEEDVQEIVQCICSNPTVDYGTFMISCDKCHVWYHGECVGIAEKDNIETWYCNNCKA